MISLEGQKFFYFNKELKEDPRENAENIMYLVFKESDDGEDKLTAYEVSETLATYGDVYVVKDSSIGFFAEFQCYDEEKLTDLEGGNLEQVIQRILHEDIFQGKLIGAYGYYESLLI